jgi:putative DNA primase/helicase
VAISTGEMDLETFIATAGRKTKAGQRLLNIPLSKAASTTTRTAKARRRAERCLPAPSRRCRADRLADHQQQAIDTVRETRWRSLIPADYGEQVHRVGTFCHSGGGFIAG